jgi:DNA-binding protein YbaB
MDQKEYSQKDRKKEFLSKSMDELALFQENILSKIITFVDKEQITLTMNNLQIIQSLKISEMLLLAPEKKIIRERLARLINEAILTSSINVANAAKNAFSYQEWHEIISNEEHEVKENIEGLGENISPILQVISSMRKAVVSKSGKVGVVISGARVINTLSINDDYIVPENKALLETELVETVNRAMREIQEEIQVLLKNNEEKITNNKNQE